MMQGVCWGGLLKREGGMTKKNKGGMMKGMEGVDDKKD